MVHNTTEFAKVLKKLWMVVLLHKLAYPIIAVSSISITPFNSEVVAGESLALTCTATTTGGGGTPSFTWTGQVSRGPLQGQAVQGSPNTFTDMLALERVLAGSIAAKHGNTSNLLTHLLGYITALQLENGKQSKEVIETFCHIIQNFIESSRIRCAYLSEKLENNFILSYGFSKSFALF